MIERIETLHEKNILHRDIKPQNFVIGLGDKQDLIYIIDFGLAKFFIRNGKHIPYIDGKGMVGTARYVSIKTHKGIEQARRDDLEGIAYTLIYFLKGRLPWQGIKAKDKKQKYQKIMEMKVNTTLEQLC